LIGKYDCLTSHLDLFVAGGRVTNTVEIAKKVPYNGRNDSPKTRIRKDEEGEEKENASETQSNTSGRQGKDKS